MGCRVIRPCHSTSTVGLSSRVVFQYSLALSCRECGKSYGRGNGQNSRRHSPCAVAVSQGTASRDFEPGVQTNEYGSASSRVKRVGTPGRPIGGGDEPFLIAQRCPQAVVAVGADRVALGRWVLERYPVDCIVLDDGFQHLGLHRDVDLVLLDATDAAGLDALLPAGRLREPLTGLDRASAIIITRAEVRQDVDAVRDRLQAVACSQSSIMEVVFGPASLVALLSGAQQPVGWGLRKKAWLVSGIGNSRSFRRSAESIGIEILGESAFEDHHHYTHSEIEQIRIAVRATGSEFVLTTEKDGGKLAALLTPDDPWWMLRLETDVVHGEEPLRKLIGVSPSEGNQRLEFHA